jgi:hypothetical protein
MRHHMNMIPSILQPLGDIVLEKQEVAIQSDLSVQAAEDDPDNYASVVAGQETEDTAPPILATPPSNSGGSRKWGVATTATTSSSKKKKVAAQCRKGAHVKVTRSNLFHVLEHDEQRETLKGYGNRRNYYGRTLAGSGKQGYNICFDDLPAGFQDVTIQRQILIAVVKDGEKEKEHNHVNQLAAEDLAEITQKPAQKELPEKESINKLCSLEKDTLFPTKKFDLRWGPEVMMKSSIGKYLSMVNTSPKIHLMFRIVWTTCQPTRIMSRAMTQISTTCSSSYFSIRCRTCEDAGVWKTRGCNFWRQL